MLNSLASYLFGYQEPSPAQAIDSAAQRLSAEPDLPSARQTSSSAESDEDDWLLVEASAIENDENMSAVRISRSASLSSLPCQPMEESWFLTPPPCFTSTAPSGLETSPLENLLIEHPSMSVYHGRVRARSASPPAAAPAPTLPPQPHPRQPLAAVTDQRALHALDIKAAAKYVLQYQKKQVAQLMNRNQLDRSNKVREVNSRSRRQRRSDRQQQHSGANNNRKCC
ncbi:tumor protein p53-inducible nuclear protein 2 isoform X1 [Homalodisca vitripennis]|uniref:tumor protein p53-inducible nuclear protein 2 isoform X1 n=1 Tax=Homalodisca vitripennis TaxID=197043 RepID=UPI001EEAC6FC|nr:tumor protein p53-inducible nuclear protein 2 isoform X1 [Homalodisca vitripennis]